MQDPPREPLCRHDKAVLRPGREWPDKFYCYGCERTLAGYELPEGWLRDYWRGAKEAWSGR